MRYDVIVVGAGPAGSTTAREAASRGLSVLMLDKAEFPRDKPCGGGVTIRAAGLLPFEITPVVERVIFGMRVSVRRSKKFIDRRSDRELTYLTQRSRFDAFLVEKAIESGVTFRQRSAVTELVRYPTHVVVRTPSEVFEGTTLVAADGANGVTAKLAGVDVALTQGIAFEGNVTPSGEFPKQWEDMLGLDLGGTPGGYGWIFPKGDHLNIGIGGWKHTGPSLRSRLTELVHFYGFDHSDMWGMRGHHLPIRRSGSPLVDGNVVLVGDAAGLLDPMSGEGIFAAIWSGGAAARHLKAYLSGEAPDLDGYRQEVERDLIPDLLVSRRFHDLFHLTPGIYIGLERRTSIIWQLACRIMLGEQTYTGVMQMHPKIATVVEFLSDLVRVTPFLQRLSGQRDPAPPQRFFQRTAQHR